MGIEKVIESYRKPLELIKEGIGYIDTESEHGKRFIAEAQKVIDTLIENLPNVQKMYEEMEEKFEVEKDRKNDAYFFILEVAISTSTSKALQRKERRLAKFWANNLKAPEEKKGKK